MSLSYEVDFYKQFKLVPPTCGLISRVTSPKGVRVQEPDGYMYYKLYTDSSIIYDGKAVTLKPGLYWVMDVCNVLGAMTWNHYLFIISKDGKVAPVAEYLHQHDSSWVKKAIKVVKSYYNKEKLQPIELTKIQHKSEDNTHWKSRSKS